MFIEPDTPENREAMRQWMYGEEVRNLMLINQKRYRELKILVAHCAPEDLKMYQDELSLNILRHREHQVGFELFESGKQALEVIKKIMKTQPHMKHPDLDFYKKIESGEL